MAGNDPDRTAKTASEANFLTDCFIPKMVSRLAVLTVAENRDFLNNVLYSAADPDVFRPRGSGSGSIIKQK